MLQRYKNAMEMELETQLQKYLTTQDTIPSERCIVYSLDRLGFFAEINLMLAVLAYCFSNNIRFFLCDRNWNHSVKDGWHDYFRSLQVTSLSIDNADPKIRLKWQVARCFAPMSRISNGIINGSFAGVEVKSLSLTHEILESRFSQVSTEDGLIRFVDLQSAFAQLLFRFSPKIMERVMTRVKSLDLMDRRYLSVHIRRGDKILENPRIESAKFIDCIEALGIEYDAIFVASDDFRAVEEIRRARPDWDVKTLVLPSKTGHDQPTFNKLSKQEKLEETLLLLTEVYLHCQADYFLGSISSNVSRFIALNRADGKSTISMDHPAGSNVEPYFSFWNNNHKAVQAEAA